VGVITPWNTPFMPSTWKIAPDWRQAHRVHKPTEWSRHRTLLSEICLNAGLPPGVLNTVHGFGEDRAARSTRSRHQGVGFAAKRDRHRLMAQARRP